MITIVQTSGGEAFIGEMEIFGSTQKILKNPRVLRITPPQVKGGSVGIGFDQILFNPKTIELNSYQFSFQAPEEIEQVYRSSLTGLVIAKSIPKQHNH